MTRQCLGEYFIIPRVHASYPKASARHRSIILAGRSIITGRNTVHRQNSTRPSVVGTVCDKTNSLPITGTGLISVPLDIIWTAVQDKGGPFPPRPPSLSPTTSSYDDLPPPPSPTVALSVHPSRLVSLFTLPRPQFFPCRRYSFVRRTTGGLHWPNRKQCPSDFVCGNKAWCSFAVKLQLS